LAVYFAAFERHGFDKLNYVLLSTLNDDELSSLIGVEKTGHRRLLLAEFQLLQR
jgi:molybdenum cofactor biosynthesis enzyme MoaA